MYIPVSVHLPVYLFVSLSAEPEFLGEPSLIDRSICLHLLHVYRGVPVLVIARILAQIS